MTKQEKTIANNTVVNMKKQKINPDAYAISDGANCISLQKVLNVVCEVLNVDPLDVQSKKRFKDIVNARHYYFYLAYRIESKKNKNNKKNKTLVNIGKFVNRDHSTAIYGKNKIDNEMDMYQDVFDLVKKMKLKILVKTSDSTIIEEKEDVKINRLHVGYYDTPEKIQELAERLQEKKEQKQND